MNPEDNRGFDIVFRALLSLSLCLSACLLKYPQQGYEEVSKGHMVSAGSITS